MSTLHATSLLTASWFVTLVVGVVSSKVLAVVLEPSGFGYYGLLQSFVELVAMVAGLGMGVGLVRSGANRFAANDQAGVASLRQGAWLIFGVTGLLTLVTLAILRATLSRWMLGTPGHSWAIIFAAIAVLFTVASYIQVNTLNAYHRVKALAHCGVWAKVLGALFAITLVLIWRERGIVAAVIMTGVGAWLASRKFLRKEVGPLAVRVPFRDAYAGARSLLSIGVPYIGSVALSKGAMLVLPVLVVHMLDTSNVGYYRAAATVAVTYLGFLVTAMGQDYFPRVSSVSDKPDVLRSLVNEQQRLILLLAVPMILGMMALVPYIIPVVYSSRFLPAVELLEWHLIGDVFRLSSWTMSIVILSRCSGKVLLFTEALLAGSTLGMSWLGIRWFGLPGLGIAFLVSNAIYYLAVWLIVRKEINLVWNSANKWMMAVACGAALVVRLCPYTGMARWRTPVALGFAAVAGAGSLRAIWGEVKDTKTGARAQSAILGLLARVKS
jgi:PST family polysaccharide transporter